MRITTKFCVSAQPLLKTAGAALRRGSRGGESDNVLSTLEVWDGHLAAHGAQLLAGRLELVHDLAPHLAESYRSIAPESRPASIRYKSSLESSLDPEFTRSCKDFRYRRRCIPRGRDSISNWRR